MSDSPLDATTHLAAIVDAIHDAVITIDSDGTITSWSSGAERLYGRQASNAIGQSFVALARPADQESDAESWRRVNLGETVRDIDAVHRRGDGDAFPVSMTMSPIRAPAGAVAGAVIVAHDRQCPRGDDRAAQRLAAIVESSDDAIVSKDLNGIVMSWNRAAERTFGYSAAEMVGESIRRIIPADRQAEEDDVLAKLRRGERVEHFETIRQRKDGTLLPISLTVSPILDAKGRVIGASKIARDISDRRQAEAERARLLAAAEENAALTEKLNEVGTVVASVLDRNSIAQAVTDAATKGTHAEFGAFFYRIDGDDDESFMLHALSGMSREEFSDVAMPRAKLFDDKFQGVAVVRSDHLSIDPRFADNGPYSGVPLAHLPVRSYLAVPVRSRRGAVLGGLFFGHPAAGVFTDRHERLVVGIASWASVALENARLYRSVQEADRLKEEFLATLSHELRTPLNAILGYARMLRSGIVRAEKYSKAVETIERNATSLTQIVEDVLDVSRIVSGKMRLNVQRVDLPAVVSNALDAVIPAAEAKGIDIETALKPPEGAITGDPERLQQIVWNLVSNAVKFTDRGGRVEVRIEEVGSHAEVIVTDTGIGIAREFLPHMFERFRQGDSGTTREHGGLGLGLAITRQLAEMHGGSVEAESEGTGRGSTFRLKLPLATARREQDATRRLHHAHIAGATISIPNLDGVRVLAVDDDSDALGLVREILEATGADVVVADSGSAALKALESLRPHVLVADLGMPRMDGFDLIARVRRNDDIAVRDVPAAALTAYARSEDRARALRSGFQVHLAKPIDPAELMAAIASLARRGVQS